MHPPARTAPRPCWESRATGSRSSSAWAGGREEKTGRGVSKSGWLWEGRVVVIPLFKVLQFDVLAKFWWNSGDIGELWWNSDEHVVEILAKFWKNVLNNGKPTKAITQPSHTGWHLKVGVELAPRLYPGPLGGKRWWRLWLHPFHGFVAAVLRRCAWTLSWRFCVVHESSSHRQSGRIKIHTYEAKGPLYSFHYVPPKLQSIWVPFSPICQN